MSSLEEEKLSKESIVPIIKTDIFCENENMNFAMVSINHDDILDYEPGSIAQAYLKLRANVYIDQTGFLSEGSKRVDGTELDEDDERSTHLVVLENRLGNAAVFACMRIIEKTDNNSAGLPIEEFFNETFSIKEAPLNSVEISRFIVRHDEKEKIANAKKMLISGAVARTFDGDFDSVYAVIETNLERDLRMMRIPTSRVAEPKFIAEYNTNNLGVEIDKYGCRKRIGEEAFRAALGSLNGETYFWK